VSLKCKVGVKRNEIWIKISGYLKMFKWSVM
jgi:hypothetical protein